MDEMLLFVLLVPIVSIILFIAVFYYIGIINTRNMFLVDALCEYGGTIVYQGVSFKVQKGAHIDVNMNGIIVCNPDGSVRSFKTVNTIFAQAPVVTIGDQD